MSLLSTNTNKLVVNRKKGGERPFYELFLNGQEIKKITDLKVIDKTERTYVKLEIDIDELNINQFQ